MTLLRATSFLFVTVLFSTAVHSQDEFEYVEVLDEPHYSLTNRFHFDLELATLPLDAYYKPLLLEAAASYQFHELFSLEIIRFGFPFYVHDTGLNNQIAALVTAADPDNPQGSDTSKELRDMRYRLSSTLFLNLLYSKSNWFNREIVYHFWQVGIGPSFADMKHAKQYGVDLTARVRFFLSNRWMLNMRGGMSFGFNSDAPSQMLFFSVGGGVAL